jgi:hypothetical protein
MRLLRPALVLSALCASDIACSQTNFTTATLLTPIDGGVFQAGGNVLASATSTTDGADSIASVTFLSSTSVLGVATNGPYYSVLWSNVPTGYFAVSAIAQNTAGVSGTSQVVHVTVTTNVLQNGGFEAGNFTNWTLVGTPPTSHGPYNFVGYLENQGLTGIIVHSGYYGAYLGDIHVATLSQTLSTIPGQYYLLSLWLDNPRSGTNQYFAVSWNTNSTATNVLFSMVNPPAFSWTKFQFLVMGTDTNATLELQAENDPSYFGLDDVYVTPIPPPTLQPGAISTNGFQLSWLTSPGVAYQVQYKTNLIQPNWNDLIPAFVATGNSFSLVDTNSVGSSERFYRLVLPQ